MKKKKIISAVLFTVGICILLFSGYKIYEINREYKASESYYEELGKNKTVSVKEKENKTEEKMLPDFSALKSINTDIYAWISIPSIGVDYPVLQGENNNSYLHTLPDGTYNKGGSIFIDERCENDFSSPVTVIYGHCMKDNSMFGLLNRFLDTSFLNNNKSYEIYTPEKTITPVIIACFETSEKSDIYNLPSAGNKKRYLKMLSELCGTDLTAEAFSDKRIIILSTCSFSFEGARTVVVSVF